MSVLSSPFRRRSWTGMCMVATPLGEIRSLTSLELRLSTRQAWETVVTGLRPMVDFWVQLDGRDHEQSSSIMGV